MRFLNFLTNLNNPTFTRVKRALIIILITDLLISGVFWYGERYAGELELGVIFLLFPILGLVILAGIIAIFWVPGGILVKLLYSILIVFVLLFTLGLLSTIVGVIFKQLY